MARETLPSSPNLFEQTQGRIWGKSDVIAMVRLTVKNAGFRSPTGEQIQTVLESVPEIFPEDWQCPSVESLARYSDQYLNPSQQVVFTRLQTLGKDPITGRALEEVIKAGLEFREYSRPK